MRGSYNVPTYQLETASPAILFSDLPLLAKIATTSEVRGLVSREIRAGRGVETSTPARCTREGIGGLVWGRWSITAGQAIAQPSS